nr:SUMF1/EgtB/PvdO family nonheme iron enzyme [Candidatus Wallbacteria bacterium]
IVQYTYTSGTKFASMQTDKTIGRPLFIDLHDIYFKLERIGNKFTGYARDPNVSEWTQLGQAEIVLPATIDAGIILINQSNPSKFSAYFTDFSIYSLNSTVSSQVSELVLSKASDTAAAGAAYDLSLITAAAKYSNGSQKTVNPAWDVLTGSGILSNGKYSVQTTGETAILRASYTENGVSVSALLKLSISGGGTQMTYSVLAESVISQTAAETVINVNGGGLSTDISCGVVVPAKALPAGAVVTIGKAEPPAPVKSGIDASKTVQLMPDVLISAKSSQGGAVSFSGPIYFDIPASRLGADSSRLLITCYNGKEVKYLAGRVTGDKFRIEIDPSLIKPQAAAAYPASPAAPDREVIIVERFELASIVISIRNGISGAVRALDDTFNTEDPGLIMGSLNSGRQNVLVLHGIFSQTRLLGASDKPLKDFLTENGYNVLTFNYKYWESNFDNGVTLAQRIMALTNDKMPLTIVCHSMGGLVTRWALNYLAANGKSNLIEKVVFLSTPNRGGKMGSKNLSEWQEYLNSAFFDAARLYQKFGLTKISDISMGGFYFSSNLDNWPVGFLQLIGDKYDNSNFLASLNKYIAGRDYLNTSYYAMIDNNDEFVDVESIDFNSFYKTDKYPYSQCENFKNKSGFPLINKDYEYYTSDNSKHSATHNTALRETSKDLLNFVKKLKSLSITPASASLNAGGSLDLSFFAASAVYYNDTGEQVLPQWEVKSGGGSISANKYTAPSTSAKAVLIASYTDKDILKTAEVSIDISSVEQNLIVDIGGGASIEFVKIKAGTFIMGSPETETGSNSDERPAHQVTITKDFYIGKYEITQKQWIAVMNTNPSPAEYGIGDNYPVHKINSSDCFLFISKLNAKNLGKGTFKLPSEAQWEYACRAGTATPYYLASADPLDSCAWYSNNSKTGSPTGYATTHQAGQKMPNAFGLYDMLGNVSEFCSDMYAGASYTSDPAVDPAGESGYGSYSSHVLRGGNYNSGATGCRCAERAYMLDEANISAGSAYGGYGNGMR